MNFKSTKSRGKQNPVIEASIDAKLAELCALQQPGQTFTYREISAYCGWSHGGAFAVEAHALKKLRSIILRETGPLDGLPLVSLIAKF